MILKHHITNKIGLKLFLIFFIYFLIINKKIQAQSDGGSTHFDSFVPMSPNSFEFIKHTLFPISMFTGTANINIPIYTATTGDIAVDISVDYSNNGIKVDQMATTVGLGWVLNAGGIISRTVRGNPDGYGFNFPEDELDTDFSEDEIEYIYSTNGNVNTEYDIFSYRVGEYSGKFTLDESSKTFYLDNTSVKIDFIGNKNTFIIKDPNGTKYEFGGNEIETSDSKRFVPGITTGVFKETTSYFLKKISTISGDSIVFTYDELEYTAKIGYSESVRIPTTKNCIYAEESVCCPEEPEFNSNLQLSFISTRIIKKIETSKGTVINFLYSELNPHYGTNTDALLSKIEITNYKSNIKKEFNFSYSITDNYNPFLTEVKEKGKPAWEFYYKEMESFPERLTFGRDHWGYYNGKDNNSHLIPNTYANRLSELNLELGDREIDTNFVDYGMLTEVQFPTGSAQYIEYESNSYFGSTVSDPIYDTKILKTYGTVSSPDTSSLILDNIYSNQFEVNISYKFENTSNSHRLEYAGEARIVDNTSGEVLYENVFYEMEDVERNIPLTLQVTPGHSYSFLIVYTNPDGMTLETKYVSTPSTTTYGNIKTGGLRVKKLILDDLEKYYYYNDYTWKNKSSGYKLNDPYYKSEGNFQLKYVDPGIGLCESLDCSYAIIASISSHNLFHNNGMAVVYPIVTESIGGDEFEGGGTTHYFKVSLENGGRYLYGEKSIETSSRENTGKLNGVEYKTEFFKLENNRQVFSRIIEKSYKYEISILDSLKNYVIHRFYESACPTYYNDLKIKNYSILKYNLYTNWFYLAEEKVTDFSVDGDSIVQNTSKYIYNDKFNPQLSEKRTYGSIDSLSEKYLYTTDYALPDSYSGEDTIINGLKFMVDNNMVGIPIETIQVLGDKIIGGKITNYQKNEFGHVVPYKSTVMETTMPQNEDPNENNNNPTLFNNSYIKIAGNSSTFEKDNLYPDSPEIKYFYGKSGNVIQVNKRNEIIPTSYLWGYNNTLPVAKIVGLPYNEVINKVSPENIQEKTGEELAAMLSPLRELDAMVTIYTYDPLIGMTSMINENGLTTHYEYDEFGRLKCTRDDDGNIINTYKYHYAGQEE